MRVVTRALGSRSATVSVGAMVALAATVAGCLYGQGPDSKAGQDPGGTPPNSADAAVTAYNTLAAQLDQRKVRFLDDSADELQPVKNQLYWLEFPGYDPTLHRYDDASGLRVDYTFSIGTGDAYNFRASPSLVVTALSDGDTVVYSAYDASQPEALVAEARLPAPADEQRFWAYAVSGDEVYIVTTGGVGDGQPAPAESSAPSPSGGTTLLRWLPRSADSRPLALTTLEAAGAEVGEFYDFDVDGSTMIFIEQGRVWRLDLASSPPRATWLKNETQVSGTVHFARDGVLFAGEDGTLSFFDYASGQLIDLSERIRQSAFRLSETFATAHYVDTGFTRFGDWVVYVGQSGVFGYNLRTETVAPILLEPVSGDRRVDYRYPVALDDGTLFVTGLESTDGAVGADGPVWRLDLNAILD